MRELEPRARVGISVGGRLARMSRHWKDWRTQYWRGWRSGAGTRSWPSTGSWMAACWTDVSERGAHLYAWTVNQRSAIERLRALGVHGIATADPRLFA